MPKVLVLTANSEIDALALSQEVEGIRAAFLQSANFDLQHFSEVQAQKFVNLLMEQRADILHFAGHGRANRGIALRSGGQDAPLSAERFAQILKCLETRPRLIFLNACHTEDFAAALKSIVDVVLGARREIRDDAAREFAGTFYRGLASGVSVAASFELGRSHLELSGHDGTMLMLQERDGVDADRLRYFGHPELMASFVDDDGELVQKRNGEYNFWIWLRGVEERTDSVTYQVCHDDFKEPYWEIRRSESQNFTTSDFWSFGDVTIRATAWTRHRGIGTESTLAAALRRHYGEKPQKEIAKVIADVESK
jgi:hypothetical protein